MQPVPVGVDRRVTWQRDPFLVLPPLCAPGQARRASFGGHPWSWGV